MFSTIYVVGYLSRGLDSTSLKQFSDVNFIIMEKSAGALVLGRLKQGGTDGSWSEICAPTLILSGLMFDQIPRDFNSRDFLMETTGMAFRTKAVRIRPV